MEALAISTLKAAMELLDRREVRLRAQTSQEPVAAKVAPVVVTADAAATVAWERRAAVVVEAAAELAGPSSCMPRI